jgi:hypothetical protein
MQILGPAGVLRRLPYMIRKAAHMGKRRFLPNDLGKLETRPDRE